VSIGAFVPFVHLVLYAEDIGISHTVAVAILSVLGIGSIAGRLAVGGFADRVGRETLRIAVFVRMSGGARAIDAAIVSPWSAICAAKRRL
jgi:MFS transporter, OFA family, oxalate/formate antiporter